MKSRIPQNWCCSVTAKSFLPIALTLLLLFSVRCGVVAGSDPSKLDRAVSNSTAPDQPSADPIFTDVTASARLHRIGYTFGDPIWGDFDNDGNLDLFVDNHYNISSLLYRNNGNGTFSDIRPISGLRPAGDRHGSAWVDFNNDGVLDLSVTKGAHGGHGLGDKKDELYQNLGANQFTDIADPAGVTNTWGRGRSVAWGDYDNDGYVDLLLGNTETDLVLLKNNGDATFLDVTVQAGLGSLDYNECVFADYDNDGFPDICCTDTKAQNAPGDILFKNNGDGTFTNVSRQAGIGRLSQGRSIAWGDYDNDGYLDLFISRGTDDGPLAQSLYHNNRDGTFKIVSNRSGLGFTANSRAAAWGDFDNDGYLDLYVVDSGSDPVGKGANHLFKNNHNGTFTDVASTTGVQVLVASRGRGAAWGDYDNDGFLDLFVTNGEDNTDFVTGPQILFHNGRNSNHWLKINLVGTTSNRQGLGSKVTIQLGTKIQYREANGAMGHFLSQGAGPLHFGLGQATVVDQITVKWPSGVTQVLSNISADQTITVTEGQ